MRFDRVRWRATVRSSARVSAAEEKERGRRVAWTRTVAKVVTGYRKKQPKNACNGCPSPHHSYLPRPLPFNTHLPPPHRASTSSLSFRCHRPLNRVSPSLSLLQPAAMSHAAAAHSHSIIAHNGTRRQQAELHHNGVCASSPWPACRASISHTFLSACLLLLLFCVCVSPPSFSSAAVDPYEERDYRKSSALVRQNPLLVKIQTGKGKATTYHLPPEGFTYGRRDHALEEGVKEGQSTHTTYADRCRE